MTVQIREVTAQSNCERFEKKRNQANHMRIAESGLVYPGGDQYMTTDVVQIELKTVAIGMTSALIRGIAMAS